MAFNIKKYLPSKESIRAIIRGAGSVIDITGTYFLDKPYWMKSGLTP